MRRLYRTDPAAFETTYGTRGHLVLGLYDSARDALATDEPETGDTNYDPHTTDDDPQEAA